MYIYLCECTVYVLDLRRKLVQLLFLFSIQFPLMSVGDGFVNIKCIKSVCIRKQIVVNFVSLLLPLESML